MTVYAVVVESDQGMEIPDNLIGQTVAVIQASKEPFKFLVEQYDGNCWWVHASQIEPPSPDTE